MWSTILPVRPFALLLALSLAACAGPGGVPSDAAAPPPGAAPTGTAPTGFPAAGVPTTATLDALARPERPVAAPEDYLIGSHDLLKVEVFGVPDLTRSVCVSASGQIALPLIGAVQAAGLSGGQLAVLR